MEVEKFDSKEKAEARCDELIANLNKCETIGGMFCPLINGSCAVSCVCFAMPRVRGNQDGGYNSAPSTVWHVYPHYCGNEMFYKEEYNVNSRSC